MSTEHPLHELAMQIRYDLTAAQGKLTEMCRAIGELDFDDTPRESFMNGPVTADSCWSCGVGGNIHTEDCKAFVHLGNGVAAAVARAHIPTQEPTLMGLSDTPPPCGCPHGYAESPGLAVKETFHVCDGPDANG